MGLEYSKDISVKGWEEVVAKGCDCETYGQLIVLEMVGYAGPVGSQCFGVEVVRCGGCDKVLLRKHGSPIAHVYDQQDSLIVCGLHHPEVLPSVETYG